MVLKQYADDNEVTEVGVYEREGERLIVLFDRNSAKFSLEQ